MNGANNAPAAGGGAVGIGNRCSEFLSSILLVTRLIMAICIAVYFYTLVYPDESPYVIYAPFVIIYGQCS